MKKTILAVSLALLLLVSCATKKPVEAESEPEVVQTTVVEQLPPVEETPAASAEPAIEAQELPEEEKQIVSEPEVVSQEPVTETSVAEPSETVSFTEEQTLPETDWGHVFTSSEVPADEKTEPKAESESKPETVAAPTASVQSPVKAESPAISQPSPSVQENKEPSLTDKVLNFISHALKSYKSFLI